jgi:ABC-type transport system involved in multi-copper enzyme maturation permease subunit
MLLGPIFRTELLRTARRGRYYILRFVYGAILLLFFGSVYAGTFGGAQSATIAAVAMFALETFFTFVIVQLVTVLVLIPPLFGGTIADEKQRRTLHYLMASQLTASEIVVDKVLGRLPVLAILLAMGLPIVSILGLIGGVSPEYVAGAFIGTVSTCAFAVALTVLVSTLTRRVRQAVLIAYLLLFAWLLVPKIVDLFGSRLYSLAYQWIRPVNTWLVATSPIGIIFRVPLRGAAPASLWSVLTDFAWMVGLQLGGAVLFLLLAVWGLRPVFRRQEETPARRTWFGNSGPRRRFGRWFGRPECGNDAVLWKERYFAPADIFTKLVLLPAIVCVTLPLAMITEVQGGISQVAVDFWQHGPGAARFHSEGLVWALRLDLGWYTAFWLLAVAGASASSVTIERDEDTWVSLTATPLTGWQILRAKALGAVWNQRGFAAVLVFVWLVALLTSAVRPLGVLASIALVGVLTWLVAAVGIYFSLRATNTTRALVSTIVALCLFNGYPFIFVFWFIRTISWDSSFTLLGFMPRLAVAPLVSPDFVAEPWWGAARPLAFYVDPLAFVPIGRLVLVVFYAGAAAVLTWRVVSRFDRWLDRPTLSASD